MIRPTIQAAWLGGGRGRPESRHQQEVVPIAPPVSKPAVGHKEQRVADPKSYLAQLAFDPLPRPMDGKHRRLVTARKPALEQRLSDQRRFGADHGLEVAGPSPAKSSRWPSSAEARPRVVLQVENLVGLANKAEPVAVAENGFGSNRRQEITGRVREWRGTDPERWRRPATSTVLPPSGPRVLDDHVDDETPGFLLRFLQDLAHARGGAAGSAGPAASDPRIAIGSPTTVISKKPSSGSPEAIRRPEITRLVEVPITRHHAAQQGGK